MTNLEKIAASELKYSPQAVLLIANMSDTFDVDAFEAWQQERFIVGGGDVISFLELQNKKTPVIRNMQQDAVE